MCGEARYRSSLAALWVESYLYGFYALLFCGFIWVRINVQIQPNIYFLVVACAMFAISTAAIVNDLAGFLVAPVPTAHYVCMGAVCQACPGFTESQSDRDAYYMTQLLGPALFRTNQLIADTLLCFRCYVVWQSWRVVAIPAFLLLATAATGYAETYYTSKFYAMQSENTTIPIEAGLKIAALSNTTHIAATFLSIVSHVILSGLMVFRIWKIVRGLRGHMPQTSSRRYRNLVSIIIESGTIYTASQIAVVVQDYIMSYINANIISDALNQIVGIVPILIIVRVALHRDIEATMIHSSRIVSSLSRSSEYRTPVELGTVGPRKMRKVEIRHPSEVSDDAMDKKGISVQLSRGSLRER